MFLRQIREGYFTGIKEESSNIVLKGTRIHSSWMVSFLVSILLLLSCHFYLPLYLFQFTFSSPGMTFTSILLTLLNSQCLPTHHYSHPKLKLKMIHANLFDFTILTVFKFLIFYRSNFLLTDLGHWDCPPFGNLQTSDGQHGCLYAALQK